MDDVKLYGRTVLITGSNSGIGRQAAKQLSLRGARVVIGCRSEQKGEEAREEIVRETGSEDIHCRLLDLTSLDSVRRFTAEFNNEERRLDILINNSSVIHTTRRLTRDGHEIHFGTNYLGHFLLTYLLLEKLKESAMSRVIIVSSNAHENHPLDLDDLEMDRSREYWPLAAYGRSRSANILFSTHLARVLEGTGVSVYVVNPGGARKGVLGQALSDSTRLLSNYLNTYNRSSAVSSSSNSNSSSSSSCTELGVATTLYCCLEPSIANHSGRYYSDSKEAVARSHATDPLRAAQLWSISLEMCGLHFTLPEDASKTFTSYCTPE